MNLSSELISQLVKVTYDEETTSNESTVYGTTVKYDGKIYVRIDGSDRMTPVSTTTDMSAGDRVVVAIKDHTATVTGNLSSPSARYDDVQEIGNKITEAEILIADKVDTIQLAAEIARIDTLVSDNITVKETLTATEIIVDKLQAENVTINEKLIAAEADIDDLSTKKLDASVADITFATIKDLEVEQATVRNLEATFGSFRDLTTLNLDAVNATIDNLYTDKLSATEAEIKYANIDFSNIGEAAVEKLFTDSGIIKDLIMSDGKVTGELVGVTIIGDYIKGGTIQADKLVIKGEDGLYYKMNIEGGATVSEAISEEELQNGLSGSIIVAKSITAEKVAVDDLVAFGATIGGFHITNRSLYSGVKSSVNNTTRGIYQDNEGQFAVGDSNNYLKFFRDSDGSYKLAIAANTIKMSATGKTVEEVVQEAVDAADIRIGARNLIRNSATLVFDEYDFIDMSTSAVLGLGQLGRLTLGESTGTPVYADPVPSEPEVSTMAMARQSTSDDYSSQGFANGMVLHDHHLIAMEQAIMKALDGVPAARITTIFVPSYGWSSSGSVYSQDIDVPGITAKSKIDLLPSPEQMTELLTAGISLTAVNSDGYVTFFALGRAPISDMDMQAMITEVIIPEVSV